MTHNLDIHTSGSTNIFRQLRESLEFDGQPCSLRKLEQKMREKCGKTISNPHISEIESGKREPSLNELLLYHRFFNISLEELVDAECELPLTAISRWLDYLKSTNDSNMYDLYTSMATTEKGHALLFYLSKFIEGSTDSVKFVNQLTSLNNSDFSSYTDYQTIRATVDSMVDDFKE